jgi:hypothetical protein
MIREGPRWWMSNLYDPFGKIPVHSLLSRYGVASGFKSTLSARGVDLYIYTYTQTEKKKRVLELWKLLSNGKV